MVHKQPGNEFSKISQISEFLSDIATDSTFPGTKLIGDDAAVINLSSAKHILFASDMMVENVHFSRSYFNSAEIGYRSIATNVSDIAAMGAEPRFATIALACPSDFQIIDFYKGIKEACVEYQLRIAGGDLSSSALVVSSVAVLGSSEYQPLLRSTAQEGDAIFVTGNLGSSALGLELLRLDNKSDGIHQKRHKKPHAKLAQGRLLSQIAASAAIDVSDGFIADLDHICSQSNVGANLGLVPTSAGVTLENAMYGGEDYELLFCHSNPELVFAKFTEYGLPEPFLLGNIVSKKGIWLNDEPVEIKGFQHFS